MINQVYTFPQTHHFQIRLQKNFGLTTYRNPNKPVICFGFYPGTNESIDLMLKNKSLVIIVWAGSDAMRIVYDKNKKLAQKIANHHKFKHIAISRYIEEDLKKVNIDYKFLPVVSTITSLFQPTMLGKDIFYYNSHKKSEFYGVPIAERALKHFPNIIGRTGFSTGSGHIPFEEMPSVYHECFMGLRLTPHDGLSNTVIELGLMGRKCVCNAGYPNCIPWKTEQDIIDAIKQEQNKIGKFQIDVAEQMRKYVDIGTDWLKESFYA